MLSIGQFASQAQVSARTVRYYESLGLLPTSPRGENNYRFYNPDLLERMSRIRDLQSLGFSLDDIKMIISFSDAELKVRLNERLLEIEVEMDNLEERRSRVRNLLSVSDKIKTGEVLTATERNLYMENFREEVMRGLRARYDGLSESALAYLKRDTWLDMHPQVGEFIEAVKKCMDFAKRKNLAVGTARGSLPASISAFSLGLSVVDPLKYEMVPERLSAQSPLFHIDVEFERGQEFVDYCREINKSLSYGEVQAFKMPLIDIVKATHKAIGKEIQYDGIDDDSDLVLEPFRNRDLEKIFQFDFSADALIMNFERFLPEFLGLQKMREHFEGQEVFTFRDIINITALWRPHSQEIVDRINLYRQAKARQFSYGFLSREMEAWLRPNFGVIIYHEDLIKIISDSTGWDLAKSNSLRRVCMKGKNAQRDQDPNWLEFQTMVPQTMIDLLAEESKWTFCMPHAFAFGRFTKQTAVLKTLHKVAYYNEIERFEQKHGFRWDDIGIHIKGISLHQG